MPKETFFNLPDKKRALIEETAVSEFAAHGYDNASINRIVAGAKIAKGSFYQYFADKKDLYKHLMARITEKKLDYISPVLQNPGDHDFFTLLQAAYRSGLDFARQNPQAARIGNQIFKHRDHPIHQELFKDGTDAGKAFYEQLIRLAISRGEIRPDINIPFVIRILNTLNVATFEYYFETVKGDNFNMTAIDDDVMDTVNLFIGFIKNGIGV
ncbi:MAG: TetR/AcrR family transcriptional regulator [Chloroflexi bacterium]|nr:TetR/AcrR family transcriptional regulator [Chloroflexota bacterium]